MKKLGIILVLLVIISSCKNTNTPDHTVVKFLSSMYGMDYEMAKSLSTRNTVNIINIIEHKTKHVTEEEKAELIGKLRVSIDSTITETDSTYLVYYKTEPNFQIFPVIRVLAQTDQDGRVRFKIDNSSLDSITGGDELIITETVQPFEEDTVSVENAK